MQIIMCVCVSEITTLLHGESVYIIKTLKFSINRTSSHLWGAVFPECLSTQALWYVMKAFIAKMA